MEERKLLLKLDRSPSSVACRSSVAGDNAFSLTTLLKIYIFGLNVCPSLCSMVQKFMWILMKIGIWHASRYCS